MLEDNTVKLPEEGGRQGTSVGRQRCEAVEGKGGWLGNGVGRQRGEGEWCRTSVESQRCETTGGKEGARGPVLEGNAVKARDKKKCQWPRAERQTCEAFRKK